MKNRVVYAIYSHTNPAQVLRLVRAIRALSPQSHIVVHHDPTSSKLRAEDAASAGAVAIPNPIRGTWGDYSLVEQHLHTMRWCLSNLDFEWYINLTGQTYPIKPLLDFEAFLGSARQDAFIYHFSAYDQSIWPNGEAARRYHYRYIKLPRFRYWHRVPYKLAMRTRSFANLFNRSQKLLTLFFFPRNLPTRLGLLQWRRPFGSEMPLVGANLNSNYRRLAVQKIVDYVNEHPEYKYYFSKTTIPDEVFFSTIVANCSDIRVENRCLRHIFWPSHNAASADVMNMTHWAVLESSPDYFALKFDQSTSPDILHAIDHKLGIKPEVCQGEKNGFKLD